MNVLVLLVLVWYILLSCFLNLVYIHYLSRILDAIEILLDEWHFHLNRVKSTSYKSEVLFQKDLNINNFSEKVDRLKSFYLRRATFYDIADSKRSVINFVSSLVLVPSYFYSYRVLINELKRGNFFEMIENIYLQK